MRVYRRILNYLYLNNFLYCILYVVYISCKTVNFQNLIFQLILRAIEILSTFNFNYLHHLSIVSFGGRLIKMFNDAFKNYRTRYPHGKNGDLGTVDREDA